MAEPWRELIACKKIDPLVFFPEAFGGRDTRRVARAKKICGRCRVRSECLNYALSEGIEHGIFGGLTAEEREGLTLLRPHG